MPNPPSTKAPLPNADLHGSAPDTCEAAVLLVDVINPFDFPEADDLLRHAAPMAKAIRQLLYEARRNGVPIIYANDNFGRWRSDFRAVVQRCLEPDCKGRSIVEDLLPHEDDYFVLKPKHSAFYSTALELLLKHLGSKTLVIAGIAGNICVLFTANDAYIRDFNLIVPRDCVASNTSEENDAAIKQMRKVLKADTRSLSEVRTEILRRAIKA